MDKRAAGWTIRGMALSMLSPTLDQPDPFQAAGIPAAPDVPPSPGEMGADPFGGITPQSTNAMNLAMADTKAAGLRKRRDGTMVFRSGPHKGLTEEQARARMTANVMSGQPPVPPKNPFPNLDANAAMQRRSLASDLGLNKPMQQRPTGSLAQSLGLTTPMAGAPAARFAPAMGAAGSSGSAMPNPAKRAAGRILPTTTATTDPFAYVR